MNPPNESVNGSICKKDCWNAPFQTDFWSNTLHVARDFTMWRDVQIHVSKFFCPTFWTIGRMGHFHVHVKYSLEASISKSFRPNSLVTSIVNNHQEDVDFIAFPNKHGILASMFPRMALMVFTEPLPSNSLWVNSSKTRSRKFNNRRWRT